MAHDEYSAAQPAYVAFEQGEGLVIDLGGIHMTFKATAESTDGAYALAEFVGAPGAGSPLHTHNGEEETFYILEGTMSFQLGDDLVQAGPGAFVTVPRGLRHAFINGGAEPVRAVMLFRPAGLERYFEELLELQARPEDTPPEAFAELAARYGLDFAE